VAASIVPRYQYKNWTLGATSSFVSFRQIHQFLNHLVGKSWKPKYIVRHEAPTIRPVSSRLRRRCLGATSKPRRKAYSLSCKGDYTYHLGSRRFYNGSRWRPQWYRRLGPVPPVLIRHQRSCEQLRLCRTIRALGKTLTPTVARA
jgi:hypothetical protein